MKAVIFLSIFLSSTLTDSIWATTYTCDPTLACGCSASSTTVNARIIDGESAGSHSWGWMISLRHIGQYRCSAILLSLEYAVTNVLCVYTFKDTPSAFTILADTIHRIATPSSSAQLRVVKKIIFSSDDPNMDDIAIIQFSPLTLQSDSILAFICLPKANEDPFHINSSLVAIGWNSAESWRSSSLDSLQQVTLQVYPSTSPACRKLNSTRQFCAGTRTGDKSKTLMHCISCFPLSFFCIQI